MFGSEVESGARLRAFKLSLQFTNKWSSLEFNRELKVAISGKPSNAQIVGATTVKVTTFYVHVVRKEVGCRSN